MSLFDLVPDFLTLLQFRELASLLKFLLRWLFAATWQKGSAQQRLLQPQDLPWGPASVMKIHWKSAMVWLIDTFKQHKVSWFRFGGKTLVLPCTLVSFLPHHLNVKIKNFHTYEKS